MRLIAVKMRDWLPSASEIAVSIGDKTLMGQLVLLGNGRLYGGQFQIFPDADLRDGLLDVCVFPRANWWTLFCSGLPLLLSKKLPETAVVRLRCTTLSLSASSTTPFEIDGEMGGHLPARVSVVKNALRVLVPG